MVSCTRLVQAFEDSDEHGEEDDQTADGRIIDESMMEVSGGNVGTSLNVTNRPWNLAFELSRWNGCGR